MAKELYFSLDVESDGPIPGPYSMLSYGLAAFEPGNETPVGTHEMNLVQISNDQHPGTMEFWNGSKKNKAAYDATRVNPAAPDDAMRITRRWIEQLCNKHEAKPVCVAYPASYDFMFLYWYFIKYLGSSPFGFQALDIKTLAMSVLKAKKGFKGATKANFPTHHALDDAIEQGIMFVRIFKEVKPQYEAPTIRKLT